MIRENSYAKNRELTNARLEAEKKALEKSSHEKAQEQLGKTKFQDIAEQRYQSKLASLSGNKFDVAKMQANAKQKKKEADIQRDMLFYKKWN